MTRRHATKKSSTGATKSYAAQHVPPKPVKESSPDSVIEKRYTPWSKSLDDVEYNTAGERLHDEILGCVSYLSETAEERALVAHVTGVVSAALRKSMGGMRCEVLVFGSTDTGLRLPGSDVDLVISVQENVHKKEMLRQLSWSLREEEWCKSVIVILGARVPIISILTTDDFGSLKFDVGINNLEGTLTGEFVKKQLKELPALRPLVFVVKSALAQRDLNDAAKSGISSFAVLCMCVFYLQVNPQGLPKEYLANPIENRSLGTILSGFLKYYSRELPYRKYYIAVEDRCLVAKNTVNWMNEEWADTLVMEGPCTPGRNITTTLTARKFDEIKRSFSQVHQRIEDVMEPTQNILQTFVSVDSKFIEYRERVKRLVQSGGITSSDLRSERGPPFRGDTSSFQRPLPKVGPQRPPNPTGASSASKNARRW